MIGLPTVDDTWAKLEQDDDVRVTAWHPLECHLADVAACTWALLTHTILHDRFSVLLDRPISAADIARFTYLAAIHDIGKVNRGFQLKAQPGATDTAGHVSPLIDVLDTSTPSTARNEIIGALGLADMLPWFASEDELCDWFLTTIAHHGKPVEPMPRFRAAWWSAGPDRAPVETIARTVSAVRQWVPEAFNAAPPFPSSSTLQHAFNGLLNLADWLGSDERFFPFASEIHGRFAWAKTQAIRALEQSGLRVTAARASLGTERPQFGRFVDFADANHLQQQCYDLRAESGPSLVIVESDTGSGKTEAAFARFVTLFQAGLVDGLYFALPTRAAATQMFRRVTRMTEKLFPDAARPPVVMAVPGYIAMDGVEAVRLPHFRVQWPDDPSDQLRHRGWAAENPKRYMAGTIVIGTIDQALLSILRVKHAHLRSTALLRHLLVVDEVHASDAYMTQLTHQLLRTHLAPNGHALLMSATLGNAASSRYLDLAPLPPQDASTAPYPSIAYRFGSATGQVECESSGYEKSVDVATRPIAGEPEAILSEVEAAVSQGARVLIIRNTIADCVGTFTALERSLGREQLLCVGDVAVPHHARFAKTDREAMDRAVEDALGKNSSRAGVVVVATQTVEQSLDIDADLLFTDLCPIDVLLQRIGRLHRNPKRERPFAYKRARAVIMTPASDLNDVIRPGEVLSQHGIGTVYEDLVVLEGTRRAIDGTWVIPRMNRALVEQVTHPDRRRELAQELGPTWTSHWNYIQGRYAADCVMANLNVIDRSKPYPKAHVPNMADERIQTRLGEGDRRVTFPPTAGPFGQSLNELRIPYSLARRATAEADDEVVPAPRAGGFSFEWGGLHFTYDRLGLRLTDDARRLDG